MEINRIDVNPSAIARVLGVVTFLLVLVSIGGEISKYMFGLYTIKGLVRLFFLGSEHNIPTYFSVLLLLFASLLLAIISLLKRNQGDSFASRWAILSFGFLFMSMDELCELHEMLIVLVRMLLKTGHLGICYFEWVIPGIILVFFLGLFFLRFLLHLHPPTRLRFLIAAIIYIGGAIGFEMIGGCYFEKVGHADFIYSMIQTVEETLEMVGAIVFIWSLLEYIKYSYKDVQFRIQ